MHNVVLLLLLKKMLMLYCVAMPKEKKKQNKTHKTKHPHTTNTFKYTKAAGQCRVEYTNKNCTRTIHFLLKYQTGSYYACKPLYKIAIASTNT